MSNDNNFTIFDEFLKEFIKRNKKIEKDKSIYGTTPIKDAYFITEEDTNET